MDNILDFNMKNASSIFRDNIGQQISVELIPSSKELNRMYMEGQLINISTNSFFIKNDKGFVEMFRFEDIRFLKVI